MITAFIVISSIVLAFAFFIAWLTKPGLRQDIENPKHLFAERIQQYDEQCQKAREDRGAHPDES